MFVRVSTRVNYDIKRSMLSFYESKYLEKWLLPDEKFYKVLSKGPSKIQQKKMITFDCSDFKHYNQNIPLKIEAHFMNCTRETYYCTEVHLVITSTNEDVFVKIADDIKSDFNHLLEMFRKSINGDWVIKDNELMLSCLK